MAHRTAPLVLFASATMLSLLACSLGPRSASADDELARDDEPTSRDQRVSGGVTRAAPVNVDEGAEPPTVLEGDDVDGDATPDAPTRVVTPDVKREPAEPVRRRPIEPVNVDERDEIEPPPIEPPPVATGGDDVVGGVIDCGDSASWPAEWFRAEAEVVRLVNIERARGADCGSEGTFPPVPAVTSQANLSQSARCHSLDMATQDFFSHEGQNGSKFWERIGASGYTGGPVGENISAGHGTAASAVTGWMKSDGHCSNIMSANARAIGIGYVEDELLDDSGATGGGIDWPHLWTMVTGY